MKKIIVLLPMILITLGVFSQALPPVNLCIGEDATVCQGQQVVISNCPSGGGGSSSGGIFLNAPTNVSLTDDVYSGVVNIGFPFSFYNNTYNQCVISSNGYISFETSKAGQYSSWALGAVGPLPSTTFNDAKNTAMVCYQDMNPALGGQIQYQTIGTAPNRMFVVLYREIQMFSCTSTCSYMAIILYESSNIVELHVGNKPACPSWNSGLAIQGTENQTGTIAHITPGRNNTNWNANQDGRRFLPTSPTNTGNYTISQVPYILVSSVNTNLQWRNTLGQTFPFNNGVLTINSVPPGTTGYFLSGTACGTPIGSVSNDTTWITRTLATVTTTSTTDICSSGQGSVTANPGNGTAPFTFNWPSLGQTTQTVNNVAAGTYSVTMTDANGCPATASVTVQNQPVNFSGTTTIVSCPGGNDGTATATMTPVFGTMFYQWDDPAMQTTQTATNLAAGSYTCTVSSSVGCTGTVNVTVGEIPGMIANIVNQTDVTCNSGFDGTMELSVSQGTAPYTYFWDKSTSTTNIAMDLPVGSQTITVTDNKGCVVTVVGNLNEPSPLRIISLTPPTTICPEDQITLDVIGTGGSSPYTYTWRSNGMIVGTGPSITVDPEFTNTQYCVTLSEACGSPVHDSCTVITFPTPIVPGVMPDKPEDCVPGYFEFTNTSTNPTEIATTYFEYSDGKSTIEFGNDSTSHIFNTPNNYSIQMLVTSIYGCVYSGTFNNIVKVRPLPVADFTFSANPATFFETSIQLQNRSSTDVVSWEWFSPGSSPSYSTSKNPNFTFPQGVVGQYPVTLIVTTDFGCTDTVTYIMNVVQDVIFYSPNAFTPDGDEFNQTWRVYIEGIDIYSFELYIFNRWGEVIWESHDPEGEWDGTYNGKTVPAGTYIWRASAKDAINDGKYEFNGYINILK